MKLEDKYKAIKLRRKGNSYNDILNCIKVSKGTLSHWLKEIPLSEEQKNLLKGREKSRYEGAKANQKKALTNKERNILSARAEVEKLVNKPLFVAGLMLYWAEGTKNGSTVAFTNSDPEMVKLMMRWFREICIVPERKFRILVFIHSLLIDTDWQEKWVKITGIPAAQFIRPFVKPCVTKHRKNKLYIGTCAVRINDINLLNRIRGWQMGFWELLQGRHG